MVQNAMYTTRNKISVHRRGLFRCASISSLRRPRTLVSLSARASPAGETAFRARSLPRPRRAPIAPSLPPRARAITPPHSASSNTPTPPDAPARTIPIRSTPSNRSRAHSGRIPRSHVHPPTSTAPRARDRSRNASASRSHLIARARARREVTRARCRCARGPRAGSRTVHTIAPYTGSTRAPPETRRRDFFFFLSARENTR